MSNSIDESSLFLQPVINKIAILLVDASGSVNQNYDSSCTIFNKMKSVIKELPHEKFRVIFWNSENERTDNKFPKGVAVYPYPVDKNTIGGVFNLFSTYIGNSCLTYTYLGVDALINQSSNWLTPDTNDVYIVTDGEMGYSNISNSQKQLLGKKLVESIRNLISKYCVNLHIYTVEAVRYDFNQESFNNFAGSDVYKAIQENHLTKSITKFVTFDLSNSETGYTHISRTNAVAGFIPYKDRLFSESKISMFLQWIKETVDDMCDTLENDTSENDTSENTEIVSNKLLVMVQDLTPTLSALTLDKPMHVSDQIINNFCNIFRSTPLDFYLAKFILDDSIKNERSGQAQLLSSYQQKRRDFFKLANDLLSQSTNKYIGILNYFVSYPIDKYIVTGHKSLITHTIQIYTDSAIQYQNYIIPVMPLDFNSGSDINGQCLRQFTRFVISKLYNIDMYNDVIIYIVMMINMKIHLSDLTDNIKSAYKQLCKVMLSKKRLNSDTTELARLLTGAFPTPNNGKVDQFYNFMNIVREKFEFNTHTRVKPMTLWFALVLSYGDEILINAQLPHCLDDIKKDFPEINPLNLLAEFESLIYPYILIDIPPNIDYKCMISLEDCSDTGGYQFTGHISRSNYYCHPINIISVESYNQLFTHSETVPCPICYTDINNESFIPIGPASSNAAVTIDIATTTPNIFSTNNRSTSRVSTPTIITTSHVSTRTSHVSTPTSHVSTSKSNVSKSTTSVSARNLSNNTVLSGPSRNQKKIWVQMVGTIGSGKSTVAKALKKAILEMGGHCVIISVDDYCSKGLDFQQAICACRDDLLDLENISNSLIVAIIDTCGEAKYRKRDTVFEIRLNGWKKINFEPNYERSRLNDYLHWTLRNVLRRSSDAACINPEVAGVDKCIEVHLTKAKGVFGKYVRGILFGNYASANEAIAQLNEKADNYESIIESIDSQVDRIMCRI